MRSGIDFSRYLLGVICLLTIVLQGCRKEGLIATPGITTAEVSEVTVNSARSGGSVIDDGGAFVTSRGVVWSTFRNPDIINNEGFTEDGSGTGNFTSELTALTPSTSYFVQAYATNSEGTAYGEPKSFTTLSEFVNGADPKGRPCPGLTTFQDDRDGNIYSTVQIGDQCWMKENLRYLPVVHSSFSGSADNARYYVYNYPGTLVHEATDKDNYHNYGVLYNWPASLDACPTGWHLPGHDEWTEMERVICVALGNSNCEIIFSSDDGQTGWYGTNEGNALKSCRQVNNPLGGICATSDHPRWEYHNSIYGTDEFGFAAIPGGYRFADGNFQGQGHFGYWWTSDESSTTTARARFIDYRYSQVGHGIDPKVYGFSIRCVKDN